RDPIMRTWRTDGETTMMAHRSSSLVRPDRTGAGRAVLRAPWDGGRSSEIPGRAGGPDLAEQRRGIGGVHGLLVGRVVHPGAHVPGEPFELAAPEVLGASAGPQHLVDGADRRLGGPGLHAGEVQEPPGTVIDGSGAARSGAEGI